MWVEGDYYEICGETDLLMFDAGGSKLVYLGSFGSMAH